jgi:hypothetical protein
LALVPGRETALALPGLVRALLVVVRRVVGLAVRRWEA